MYTVINRMGQDCGHARQLTWRGGETGWWSTLMWLPTGSAVVRQHHLENHTQNSSEILEPVTVIMAVCQGDL